MQFRKRFLEGSFVKTSWRHVRDTNVGGSDLVPLTDAAKPRAAFLPEILRKPAWVQWLGFGVWWTAVERIWHIHDSQDQVMALALSGKSPLTH